MIDIKLEQDERGNLVMIRHDERNVLGPQDEVLTIFAEYMCQIDFEERPSSGD